MTIAALFVDEHGIYSKFPSVELWPMSRDARSYPGPHSVVAHPPCQLWGSFAALNYQRWGGEHNRPGNDGGCFKSALENVRMFGGVLEHPAFSRAWKNYDLWLPTKAGPGWYSCWHHRGGIMREYSCEIWQSAYGHAANKRTWLLFVGTRPPPEMRWDRPIGTHQIGFHDQRGKNANKPTVSGKRASATPIALAEALINLAILAKS